MRWLVLSGMLAGGLGVAGTHGAGVGSEGADPPASTLVAAEVPAGRPVARQATPAEPVPATAAFATFGEIVLHLPADDLLVLGFHEAAHATTHRMTPLGTLRDNRNATKFVPPRDDPDGPEYLILSSRGRRAPATSAADVVLPDDVIVRSPVTGRVADVRDYALYGRHQDARIEIVPEADADARVVVIHIADVMIRPGDQVVGGVTPIARTARRFPFGSHIDRETEPDRWPHVHIEVQPARG